MIASLVELRETFSTMKNYSGNSVIVPTAKCSTSVSESGFLFNGETRVVPFVAPQTISAGTDMMSVFIQIPVCLRSFIAASENM